MKFHASAVALLHLSAVSDQVVAAGHRHLKVNTATAAPKPPKATKAPVPTKASKAPVPTKAPKGNKGAVPAPVTAPAPVNPCAAALVNTCPSPSTYPALTDITIKTARTEWFIDKTAAEANYGPIGCWDTAKVTNMDNLFDADAINTAIGASYGSPVIFNEDISLWNTGSVTTMESMFYNEKTFDQNIGAWDTHSLRNAWGMFESASVFNQDLGCWNTASVTDMARMFKSATAFNGDVSTWNTKSVTDMDSTFSSASSFNRNLNNWNTSEVTDMEYTFNQATSFNQNLDNWDTSKVSMMTYIFKGATAFNQTLCWDVTTLCDDDQISSNMFTNSHGSLDSYPACKS